MPLSVTIISISERSHIFSIACLSNLEWSHTKIFVFAEAIILLSLQIIGQVGLLDVVRGIIVGVFIALKEWCL